MEEFYDSLLVLMQQHIVEDYRVRSGTEPGAIHLAEAERASKGLLDAIWPAIEGQLKDVHFNS